MITSGVCASGEYKVGGSWERERERACNHDMQLEDKSFVTLKSKSKRDREGEREKLTTKVFLCASFTSCTLIVVYSLHCIYYEKLNVCLFTTLENIECNQRKFV